MERQDQLASELSLPDLEAIVRAKASALAAALDGLRSKKPALGDGSPFVESLARAGNMTIVALRAGNKILAAGNGGSAAEAQHLTGEIVGRFRRDKKPLPALCLSAETSTLTAIGNDFGYESVFARQVYAFGDRGDVLFLLSTSGRSKNLLEAANVARSLGVGCVGLVGATGGELATLCDVAVVVPSEDPQVIQEMHLFAVHCIAWAVEEAFCPKDTEIEDPDSTK